MQEFSGVSYHTSDQHQDCGPARQAKDSKDSQTILQFLLERNPFNNDPKLRNIETGVEAGSSVNVEKSVEIGSKVVESLVGKNLLEHTFKKKLQAVVLTTKPTVKLDGGESIQVDPQLLFQRLITAATRLGDEISHVFEYELSTVPSSLFDASGFPRQPQKASLADAIWSLGDCKGEDFTDQVCHVLDGGSLIHRLPWAHGSTFAEICDVYRDHVTKQYTNPVIVFDGYMSGPSIKDIAHIRRSHGIFGTNVHFKESTPFKGKKDKFLSNPENKQQFINMLGTRLSINFPVFNARDDADVLIVKTTIDNAKKSKTVLVGEDTDLLILLCYYANLEHFDIVFKSGSKQQISRCSKIWDIKKTKLVLGQTVCKHLPFIHAFTGCDSSSKIHGIGKGMALKRLITDKQFQLYAEVFHGSKDKTEILRAGEKAMITLSGGHESEGLDLLRFRKFARKVTIGVTCVQVHSIPPTSAAAKYHSMRVYYQVQCWTNADTDLLPTEWGWYERNNKLFPFKTDLAPAPASLLKVIKCNCKANCDSKRCTCRKHGLECSVACGECRGIQCTNVSIIDEPEDILVDEDM